MKFLDLEISLDSSRGILIKNLGKEYSKYTDLIEYNDASYKLKSYDLKKQLLEVMTADLNDNSCLFFETTRPYWHIKTLKEKNGYSAIAFREFLGSALELKYIGKFEEFDVYVDRNDGSPTRGIILEKDLQKHHFTFNDKWNLLGQLEILSSKSKFSKGLGAFNIVLVENSPKWTITKNFKEGYDSNKFREFLFSNEYIKEIMLVEDILE